MWYNVYMIPYPPKENFADGALGLGVAQVLAENNHLYDIRKIVCGGQEWAYFDWNLLPDNIKAVVPKWEGLELLKINTGEVVPQEGQFMYFKGWLYPRKGFVFPEALWVLNIVKRATISLVFLVPFFCWIFLSRQLTSRFIYYYLNFAGFVLDPYRLGEKYQMLPAKETRKWVNSFLKHLGFNFDLGMTIGMFIEYDSAYTLRYQDIMGEIDRDALLKNPAKELGRVFKIFCEREKRVHLQAKIGRIVKLLRVVFWIPRFRKALVKATSEVNFKNLVFTEGDRYESLFLSGYDFMGRSAEDRLAELSKIHGGNIPQAKFSQSL